MQPAHCPKCSMLLAHGVLRCRYCGNTLTEAFWTEAGERAETPQIKAQETPPKKPKVTLPESLKPQMKKPRETPVQSGFQPPTVGWPAKAIGLLILLALILFIFSGETEEEEVATDCRTQCFAKEKQLANPPKHYMSGCMQTCMRP